MAAALQTVIRSRFQPAGNTITVTWGNSTDVLSNVSGYAWEFNQNPTWTCDQVLDGNATVTSATSPPLANGTWYFHVCSVDTLGNWSAPTNSPAIVVNAAAIPMLSPLVLLALAMMLALIALKRT